MAVGSRPLVPSSLAPGGLLPGHGSLRTPRSRVGGFVALTKPRIVELLLITTLPTMVLAQDGVPPLRLMVTTLVGGALAAGGANAMNMVLDRDIDRLMPRTQGRPLVTGLVAPREAVIFAIALEVAAFVLLTWQVNLLSAVLAAAMAFYIVVYTIWLKRTSTRTSSSAGGGAVPVWSGGRGDRSLARPPVVPSSHLPLTPPHFWARHPLRGLPGR
jgi:protoheme IX farnesyltransferase